MLAPWDVVYGTEQNLIVWLTKGDLSLEVLNVLDGFTLTNTIKNKATVNFRLHVTKKSDIKIGNHITIWLEGDTYPLFVGIVDDIKYKCLQIGGIWEADISAVDYSIRFDNILVTETYENTGVNDIIQDLNDKYLVAEYPYLLSMPNESHVIVKATFNYLSLRECFDYLATEVAYDWYLTGGEQLVFTSQEMELTYDIDRDEILEPFIINDSLEDYRNRQYIKGGFDTTTLNYREVLTPKPDGNSKAFFTRYPIAKVPDILIDNGGGYQTVSSTSVGIEGIDTGKWFYWNKNKNQINQDTNLIATLTTETVSCSYYGLIKILVQADNIEGQDSMLQNQPYSSGVWSKIEEMGNIETREEAGNYADGLLYKYEKVPETLNLRTGLYRDIGKLVRINYTDWTDNDLYFIESRTIDYSAKVLTYTYKLLNGQSFGDWSEFYRKLKIKSNDMLINEDTLLIKLQHNYDNVYESGQYNITATTPIYVDTATILSDVLYVGGSIVTSTVIYDT